MSKPTVTVIDYGMGNLFSVKQALEQCGAEVRFTESPDDIKYAKNLVLPGVGAFGDGMAALETRGYVKPIRDAAAAGTPLLGICLGMQMLFESSDEFGFTAGLGLVPGKVMAIPSQLANGGRRKIPHIGWGGLESRSNLFADKSFMYFVHTFYAAPSKQDMEIVTCDYDGFRFCAALEAGNILGVQFHPERSGRDGLAFLTKFVGRSRA